MYKLLTLKILFVIGITGVEILTAHVITQFSVMLGQSIMVIFCALVVFEITNHGQWIWVLILVVLDGMCGMCFGMYFISKS